MDERQESMPQQPYRVRVKGFEGPLDLLLHLVKKHELDIFDIPVAFITEKYLEYLDLMRTLNLDVAGEFVLMAATLAHIKSKEMLPHEDEEEEEEEGEDPRAELIRRLLEYQKFKDAAFQLGEFPQLGRQVWARPGSPEAEEEEEPQPLAEVGLFQLLEAFNKVLENIKPELTHDVVVDRVSLATRIQEVADLVYGKESVTFSACFKELAIQVANETMLRMEIVVTFLALLEMARLKMLKLWQAHHGGEIYLKAASDSIKVDAKELSEELDYGE